MDERVQSEQVGDSWAAHTRAKVQIFSELLSSSFLLNQNIPGYIVSQSSMQILRATSPSACHLHYACDHASF